MTTYTFTDNDGGTDVRQTGK